MTWAAGGSAATKRGSNRAVDYISRRILNNNKATFEECWVAIDDDAAPPGEHVGVWI